MLRAACKGSCNIRTDITRWKLVTVSAVFLVLPLNEKWLIFVCHIINKGYICHDVLEKEMLLERNVIRKRCIRKRYQIISQ